MRTNNPQNDSLDELIENFLDCHRRGEQPVVEDYAQRHPNHAESIRSLFPTLLAMESAASNSEDGDPSTLQVRCPHCHNQLDIIDDVSLSDLTCPSCGSHFSLIGDDTVTAPNDATRSIGHFELLEQIGIGHFGSVWKAHDAELDRIVAVKIPRKGRLDPEESEQFLREARAAAQFRHPNIVPVHEVGRHDETVFIVTDYVEGANLREWLTGQRLTIREAVSLVTKIAEALEHAHDSGVIHRDLKPGNIMLDGSGEPHLTDFGLARRETGEITMTVDGRILGTPAYMSPEQAQGKGHEADARSDVYSLGVILFELFTGELPFRGETRMLIVQIINDEPPSPRRLNNRVPRDLETICLKCLEKDPNRRYQTGRELAADLKRQSAGEPIRARPVGRLERGWRWVRRNPRVAGLTAALVLTLSTAAVGATIAAFAFNQERKRAAAAGYEAESAKADSLYSLGRVNQYDLEHPEKAEPMYREALAIYRKHGTDGSLDAGRTKYNLARIVDTANRNPEEAERLYREGLNTLRDELGDNDREVADALYQFAIFVWYRKDDFDAAERLMREGLAMRRSVHGDKAWLTHITEARLAWFLVDHRDPTQHRTDEALELARQANKGFRDQFMLLALGVVYYRVEDFPNSIRALEESLRLRGDTSVSVRCFLAMANWRLGNRDKALESFKICQKMAADDPRNREIQRYWAETNQVLGIEPDEQADRR